MSKIHLISSYLKYVRTVIIVVCTITGAKPKSIASKLISFLMGGHSSTIKSMTVSRADMFYTPEGISIKIKKGSLVQEQVKL